MKTFCFKVRRLLQVLSIPTVCAVGIITNIASGESGVDVAADVASGGGGGNGLSVGELLFSFLGSGLGGFRPMAVLVPFSSELEGLAIVPDGTKLLATDSVHNTVTIFDLPGGKALAVLDVGASPRQIAIAPDGNKAYVTNSLSNTVSVVDIPRARTVRAISVGETPKTLTLSPDGTRLYVVNNGSKSVSIIDTLTDTLRKTVSIGSSPNAAVVTPNGAKLFVANATDNTVSVLDATSEIIIDTIPVSAGPIGLAITRGGDKLYVASGGNILFSPLVSDVSVINVTTHALTTVLHVGPVPMGIGISPDGKRAYVPSAGTLDQAGICHVNRSQQRLSTIDIVNDQVITTEVPIDGPSLGLVITGDSSKVYSASRCTNTVSIVDAGAIPNQTASSVSTVTVPERSSGIVGTPNGENIYVAHGDAISRIAVQTNTLQATLAGRGDGPMALAMNAANNRLVATIPGKNAVAVIDSVNDQQIASVSVGSRPSAVVIAANRAFVANYKDGTVSIVDLGNNSLVGSIDTGFSPLPMAKAPNETKVWVGIGLSAILVIDVASNTLAPALPALDPPHALAATPNGQNVISAGESFASIVNTTNNTGADVTNLSLDHPAGISVLSSNAEAFITNHDSASLVADPTLRLKIRHAVSVVNISQRLITSEIDVLGPNPSVVKITPNDSKAYVLNTGDRSAVCAALGDQPTAFCETGRTVSVINVASRSLIRNIQVGAKPVDIALTPNGLKAFVVNYFDGTVSVISTQSDVVSATIPVGAGPLRVLVSADGTKAYVANSVGASITVIDVASNTVRGTISIGPP